MKSKPVVGIFILLFVAILAWSVNAVVGTAWLGRDGFMDWRAANVKTYYIIWLVEIVVLGLPALWLAGRHISAYTAQQDQAALAARGVGKLVASALRGNKNAIERLVKLLDDGSPAVRYQSARALAMLDDEATNEELFRKVRYWDVDHKLALVDVLKRTMDLRAIKLLRMLTEDRNPMVARKARTALAIVSSRSGNIDAFVAKRRKQAQAKQQRETRKQARRSGESRAKVAAEPATAPDAGPPAGTDAEPPAGTDAEPPEASPGASSAELPADVTPD